MRVLPILGFMLLLLAAPFAASQGQHHDASGKGNVIVSYDTPPDGRTVVGDVTHFNVILFGDDGKPQFHHNIDVSVVLNGVELFATTPDSGHDYDGVYAFDVVFPAAGNYTVTAVTAGSNGDRVGTFSGYVVPLADPEDATLSIDAPTEAVLYNTVPFTYEIVAANGSLLPHTDALVEIRGPDGALLHRVHTHSHEGAQSFTWVFGNGPGTYEVTFTAYTAFPSKSLAAFEAFRATHRVEVSPGSPGGDAPSPVVPKVPATDLNAVGTGNSPAPYLLYAAYDPYTVVGTFGQIRLSTLVLNATTNLPEQHVNFHATLVDPLGYTVWESTSLHEYDGVLEVLFGHQDPGQWRLLVEASQGDWKGSIEIPYTVAPPAAPLSVGPQIVEVSGLEGGKSGVPITGGLFIHDLAGQPFDHGEVDLQVLPAAAGAAPVLATKLHTHDDGRYSFNFTVPWAGDYVLRLAPFPLEPRTTPVFLNADNVADLDFAFTVAEGTPIPDLSAQFFEPVTDAAGDQPLPAPGLLLAAFALLAAVALRRRV